MLVRRFLFVSSFITLLAAPASAQEATLVVENGRVIMGNGRVIERGTVVVAGDRILSVTDEVVEASGARRIDAAGKTVLPGLIDAHVHLLLGDLTSQPRSTSELDARIQQDLSGRLRAFLEAGITTVMSTGDFWPAIRSVRESIHSGELVGPRIFTSGPVFTAPGGHPAVTVCGGLQGWGDVNPWCRDHLAAEVDTRAGARASVERLAGEGVDLIKMVYDSVGPPRVEHLETDVMHEIVAAAHDANLRVYAHIGEVGNAITAVNAGLDGLVHTPVRVSKEGQRQELVDAMVGRKVAAVSTAVGLEALRDRFVREGNEELARMFDAELQGLLETIRRIAEADPGLVVLGTDTPQLSPGDGFHGEVRLLGETGLTGEEVLRAATRNAAEHLGRASELGTLEAGKIADLIVVDGNPLVALSALRNVEIVIKGGEVVFAR